MRSIAAGVADASTLELVEAAEAIARELAGREAPEAGSAALEVAETLGGVVDLLEAALAPVVRRVDDTGVFAEFGFSSTGAWLRTRLGMRDGRAAERLRLARQLPHLREVTKRLAVGDLSYGFAAAISDAVTRLDREDVEPAEQILLGLADAGHTAGQLAKDAARITDLINEHRGKTKEPDDSKRGFSRSWLTESRSLDGGSWLKGWLSPEHTAIFEQILGPLAKPKAKGDDRDLGQRTADALMALLSQGHKGAGVTVIIDLRAFVDATGDTGPFTARPRPPSGEDGDAAAGRRSAHHPDDAADSESGGGPTREPEGGPDGESADDLFGSGAERSTGNGRAATGGDFSGKDAGPGHRLGSQEGLFGLIAPSDLASIRNGFGTTFERDLQEEFQEKLEQDERVNELAENHAVDGGFRGMHDPPHRHLDGDHPDGDPSPPVTGHPGSDPPREDIRHRGRTAREPESRQPNADPDGPDSHADRGGARWARDRDMTGSRFAQPRPAARLLDGTPISPERARQIALNAGINVLLLGESHLPLRLGRTVRFVTPAQRKALLALYETCCVQGCQIPAHLCEIHHTDGGWKLGTPTDIDKLVPACGWHNRWVETHADQVEQVHDDLGRTVLRLLPPWNTRWSRTGTRSVTVAAERATARPT